MRAETGAARLLDQYYASIESTLPVRWTRNYANLVVPNGNADAPVHRWFHFKEAFSGRLLERVLKDAALEDRRGLRVLDPYSGSGTTATSVALGAQDGSLDNPTVYGLETNPYLHAVSATKLMALQQPPDGFLRLARRVAATVLHGGATPPAPPLLSTFSQKGHFDPLELGRLLAIREAIREESARGASALEVDLARVCLGAVVEDVSSLRRDGRALRVVDKRTKTTAIQGFLDLAHRIDDDLPRESVRIAGRVILGDGRTFAGIDSRFKPFDLVLYSPPYPNNIDYTEVYKLENWLLEYMTSPAEFAAQRLRTVYSHPSLLRSDPIPSALLSEAENAFVQSVVQPLVSAIPQDRYQVGRTRMLRGYVVDMFLTLRSSHRVLREGGLAVYVVGNSLHGHSPEELVVAADLLMAAIGVWLGFDVERFEVARELNRRGSKSSFLRESVVFLRKGA